MRICDERKPKIDLFKEVNIGQVFYVEDTNEYGNNPFMRVFEIKSIDDDYFNAVDLQYGNLVYINDNEIIIFCNANLQIY